MCKIAEKVFRGALAAVVVCALCGAGVLLPLRSADAQRPDVDESLASLAREVERAEDQYELVLSYVHSATEERITREQAGATPEEIQALKNREANLILRAQTLKVKADTLEESYERLLKKYKRQ